MLWHWKVVSLSLSLLFLYFFTIQFEGGVWEKNIGPNKGIQESVEIWAFREWVGSHSLLMSAAIKN